jgi:tetratricopeptide (TPR) repeat protein
MSQILKRLSEADSVETETHLKVVPDNIFESTDQPPTATASQRLGLIMLGIFILGAGFFLIRGKNHLGPIVDKEKMIREEVFSINRQAVESFYGGNVEKASNLLSQASLLDPHSIPVQINQAIILRHQHKASEATAVFNQVLTLDSGNSVALNGLGRIHLDAGEFNEAETFFKRAIASNLAPPETFLNLGELAEQRGNWNLASQYYTSYLQNSNADSVLKSMISRRKQNIVAIAKAKE